MPTKKLSLPSCPPLVLLAWGSPPAGDDVGERYREFAAAGFTHGLTAFRDSRQAKRLLDAAAAAGVKLFPMLSFSKMTGPEVARRFARHRALAGYFLIDEPSAEEFPKLARQARQIMAADTDPAKVYCINLFPNYANNQQLGLAPHQKYYEYVHKFLSEVPVNVLSYDYYPIHRLTVGAGWYENMQVMLDAAKMAKLPWWAYIATVGFGMFPEPSMGSLRLQSYTNLAYGATGIEHWFYWYYQGHRGAAIDFDGRQTATYDYIRKVNTELQARAAVFVGSRVSRVRHAGKTTPAEVKPYEPRGPITSLSAGGKGAIVSELWKDDYRFLVIVNQDYLEPMPLKAGWKRGTAMGAVEKNGSVRMFAKRGLEMQVDPGDAAILMWMAEGK